MRQQQDSQTTAARLLYQKKLQEQQQAQAQAAQNGLSTPVTAHIEVPSPANAGASPSTRAGQQMQRTQSGKTGSMLPPNVPPSPANRVTTPKPTPGQRLQTPHTIKEDLAVSDGKGEHELIDTARKRNPSICTTISKPRC